MKKIKLKKIDSKTKGKTGNYKINYEQELNKAQYDAVMHNNGPALVIAGAGTGKTRTLVYRVARLIEDGANPYSILLLTFTRKAASEMIRRATTILDQRCEKIEGGTFHSFAAKILRRYAEHLNYSNSFNIIDQSDSEDIINVIRTSLKFDKERKRFPQKKTLQKILSLSINKQADTDEIIEEYFPAFIDYSDKIEMIFEKYHQYKIKYNLMDYDDLLLNLLKLIKTKPNVLKELNDRYKYIMVDEYQDSNRLQHEISIGLSGINNNIMAVGDDAQSIYSFRGADYQNIMFFPESFKKCEIFKIEQNYRSNQNILNLTNEIINTAVYKYEKELFSDKISENLPFLISAKDERQQSQFLTQQILELREEGYSLNDIAVLFRSGFHSFDLEIELENAEIPFIKFGGLKFIETSHIKDLIAYFRILHNQKDALSWHRVLLLIDGIGPRTAENIIEDITDNNLNFENHNKYKFKKSNDLLQELFGKLSEIEKSKVSLEDKAQLIAEYYRPLLKNKHDDWQKRWRDIESFINIAGRYESIRSFLNDMAIDPPSESVSELSPESKEDEFLTLSTIHSAKGLEWKAVFLIWALEGKFPSARSVENIDTLEEERRLFYVALTRAKDLLYITYPNNIFDRESGFVLSEPSRFIDSINEKFTDKYIITDGDSEDE